MNESNLIKRKKPMKVFAYRQDEEENIKAERQCKKKYGTGLSGAIRVILEREFPEIKTGKK